MSKSQTSIVEIIEHLLLNHECVVLPGLGGFIVRDSPCNFTADKSMIKPAFRNLFFNPHLTQNDGLLCHALQNENGKSYNEASALIQSFVTDFQTQIQSEQSYKFGRLGVFYNGQNNIWFAPANELNLSLDSFGLESIHIQTVAQTESLLPTPVKSLIDNAPIATLDVRKPRLKPWLVAASVALLFHVGYLFLEQAQLAPMPSQQHQAAVVPSIQLPNTPVVETADTLSYSPAVEVAPEAEVITETPAVETIQTIEPTSPEPTVKSSTASVNPPQVVAKYKIETNANFHLNDLQKKGINAELIFEDGFYQIIIK